MNSIVKVVYVFEINMYSLCRIFECHIWVGVLIRFGCLLFEKFLLQWHRFVQLYKIWQNPSTGNMAKCIVLGAPCIVRRHVQCTFMDSHRSVAGVVPGVVSGVPQSGILSKF